VTEWARLSDDELVAALQDLGAAIDYPESADQVPAVRARLTEKRPWPASRWKQPRWQLAAAVVALVVAFTAILAASPAARHAVAGWLGLRGVEIEYGGSRIPPTSAAAGSGLALGEQTSLAEAKRRASFPVLLLPERFGPPDEAYHSASPPGGRITLLYRATPELPEASITGAGLLLTQFRAQVDQAFARKVVGAGARVEEVAVAGGRGYWFEGAPHRLVFADENGQFFEDRSRLAGNTLVWERGDVTLRLESALSRDASIELAESLLPVS
jgi:hypothetical protein